ncbi:MAG: hypothetical protein WCA89_09565 [Terracidiphilus sp.]
MPTSPQGFALQTCFYYLHGFQTACSFNTNALAMDPIHFAKATIAAVIPTAYQNNFVQSATLNTGLPLNTGDLAANTFLDLLNNYRNLQNYVGGYLQSLAAGTYPAGTLTTFNAALVSAAFPGGSKGAQWKTVQDGLTGNSPQIIPPSCYSQAQQIKVGIALDAPGTVMSTVIALIAGLG